MRNRLAPLIFTLLLGFWGTAAEAARVFTFTQLSPASPGDIDMGTAQPVTVRVANTSTPTNTGERIYEMRFRLNGTCSGTPCTATQFATGTTAPAGWTRSAFSATSVTFLASSWANAIPLGGPTVDFTLVLSAGTSTQDRTETLRDARASFTLDTNFSNGIARTGRTTLNTPGSWTLKSLRITSFQTMDAAGVAPVSAIAAGTSFRLVITVMNISTVTQSGIVSNPSPPTATKIGTWTAGTPGCSLTGTSPSPLNLAAGASGTITYTCTTLLTNSGTVFFTASVRNSTSSAGSRAAVSNTLLVSVLSVGIVASPACILPGGTATFTMTVTNNTSTAMTNVTPSALGRQGTATIGTFSGPVPASVGSLAAGASTTFIWTATVSGVVPVAGAKPTFWVTGSASANGGLITSPVATSNTEDLDNYLAAAELVTAINAGSSNAVIRWAVTNRGCADVSQVQILVPGGWTTGDTYSLVTNTLGALVETWTVGGTTFSAPAAPSDRMGIDRDGDFTLVFSATPASAGVSNFTVRVTDTGGRIVDTLLPVTVNPFGTGGANDAAGGVWREEFK